PSFPKAKPAAPPSGFKPKPAAPPAGFKPKPSSLFGKPETVKKSPQAPKSIPFGGAMFQTGTQQEEKTEAGSINSLLGALGTKPTTKATTPAPEKRQSFMSFSGNSSQKQEKQSFFVPEVKEKSEPQPIKIIQPTIANQFEKPKVIPEKKKDKKDKKKGKKDKKDRKTKKDKKNQKGITVCPSCGSILSGKYKFCNKCGSKL
ncbi:MAG: hypothetical protein GY870_12685, partial [archaeon]|nr:hypothetical protein [archaeon]